MMVEARKDSDKEPVADNAASDVSRFADLSAKLFAEQASAMAVMTAYGMTVAAQMTGMMLGAFRGPGTLSDTEESRSAEQNPSVSELKPEATAGHKPVASVVELHPRSVKSAETKTGPVVEVAPKSLQKAAKPVKGKPASTRSSA